MTGEVSAPRQILLPPCTKRTTCAAASGDTRPMPGTGAGGGSGRSLALTRRDLTVLAAIVVLAAAVRLVGLNYPPRTVVDEFWYGRDGCFYWKDSADACGMANLQAPDRDVQ